jgi:hypothetical protein
MAAPDELIPLRAALKNWREISYHPESDEKPHRGVIA